MSKTINRIVDFVHHMNMSVRQFDISIGAANGYTLRMEKNNASVGSDVIERINKTYPKLNLVWLITGNGRMFIDDIKGTTTPAKIDVEAFISKKLNEKWSAEKKALLDEIINEINEQKND